MKFLEVGPDFVRASVPVDNRTLQPRGIINGGINVTLAESMCSAAASYCVDPEQFACVGLEINANHVRVAAKGKTVEGIARPLHIGRSTQIWEARLEVEGKLSCICRMTLAVIPLADLQARLGS